MRGTENVRKREGERMEGMRTEGERKRESARKREGARKRGHEG